MKKIFVRIGLILMLFIPTYLAVFFYLSAKDNPVNGDSVFALDFHDTRGQSKHYEKDQPEGAALIQLLLQIHGGAKTSESLPSELSEEDPITVTFYSHDMKSDYHYYFAPGKPSNSYYQDSEGNAFKMSATDAIAFLDSDYSACLYEGSIVPELTVLGTPLPSESLDWNYYSYSSVAHKISAPEAAALPELKSSYRSFAMSFSQAPTQSSLTVRYPSGDTLFEGTLDQFAASDSIRKTIRSDTDLVFDLDAAWEALHGRGAGGTAHYHFTAQIIFDPLADFWLGESTVEAGEFVVLSGEFVEDIGKMEVTTDPALPTEPIFFTDGEHIRAILPIDPEGIEVATEMKITVRYHTVEKAFTLNVLPTSAAVKKRKYNYGGQVDLSARNEASLDALRTLISGLPYEQSIYFTGSFRKPDEKQNRARFGDTVDNGGADDRFISKGIAFVSYKDDKIYAANSGKVIFVGKTEYGGLTLIIDHGLGLRTVYYCLGAVKVYVGDMVTKDTVVATGGGKDGYTDGHTCYQEFWVGSTPVAYYAIVEGGRTGEIVYGEPS